MGHGKLWQPWGTRHQRRRSIPSLIGPHVHHAVGLVQENEGGVGDLTTRYLAWYIEYVIVLSCYEISKYYCETQFNIQEDLSEKESMDHDSVIEWLRRWHPFQAGATDKEGTNVTVKLLFSCCFVLFRIGYSHVT